MSSRKKSTRTRANRRDRRKAKASGNFRRPGRSNPRKVGHGGSGMKTRGKPD